MMISSLPPVVVQLIVPGNKHIFLFNWESDFCVYIYYKKTPELQKILV